MPVLVESKLNDLIMVAAVGVREERRRALVDPFHRAAEGARCMRNADVFRKHRCLHAKRAADIAEDRMYLVRRHLEYFGGRHLLAESTLPAGIDRETLACLVVARD